MLKAHVIQSVYFSQVFIGPEGELNSKISLCGMFYFCIIYEDLLLIIIVLYVHDQVPYYMRQPQYHDH